MESRDIEIGDRKKGEEGKNPYRFEGNSSFNAAGFIGESFNRTEFIIGQRCTGTGKLRIPRWVLLDGFLSEARKFLALNFS